MLLIASGDMNRRLSMVLICLTWITELPRKVVLLKKFEGSTWVGLERLNIRRAKGFTLVSNRFLVIHELTETLRLSEFKQWQTGLFCPHLERVCVAGAAHYVQRSC